MLDAGYKLIRVLSNYSFFVIMRKSFSFFVVFLLISISINLLYGQENGRYNIVFVLGDDITNWDIGCYGNNDVKTPNIDKLAREGMKFNRCYQAAPICSPTRHNLLTGIYPVKSGAYPNHTFVKDGTKSLPHYLKALGYAVGLTGKKHIAPISAFPFEYIGATNEPDFELVDSFLNDASKNESNFALMICSNEAHDPWTKGKTNMPDPAVVRLPPNIIDTEETREAFARYLGEIGVLDDQVGRTMDLLEKHGFYENTFVFFASEQGNIFPFNKWSLYEAGVKSALVAWMPKVIDAGVETDAIVEYTDVLPTMIEIAGGEVPAHLDGQSFLSVLTNPDNRIRDYSYSIQTTRGILNGSDQYGIRAIVNDRYRYIWNLTPDEEFLNIVNNTDDVESSKWDIKWFSSWRRAAEKDADAADLLFRNKVRPEEELYDVIADRWCMNNLANDERYSSVIRKLKEELTEWMRRSGDKGIETELDAHRHQLRN